MDEGADVVDGGVEEEVREVNEVSVEQVVVVHVVAGRQHWRLCCVMPMLPVWTFEDEPNVRDEEGVEEEVSDDKVVEADNAGRQHWKLCCVMPMLPVWTPEVLLEAPGTNPRASCASG